MVQNGEDYSVENPACVYFQFVRVDVPIGKLEAMVTAFKTWVAKMRAKAKDHRVAQQAKLAAEAMVLNDGEQPEAEAIASVLADRSEKRKIINSAAGSAPKQKHSKPRRKSHSRFTAPACLAWPPVSKGSSVGDATATHPRAVWEAEQIVAHMRHVFDEQDAANKLNYLTGPTTYPNELKHMKDRWDEGFPPYTSQPVKAMKAALTTYWTAKQSAM